MKLPQKTGYQPYSLAGTHTAQSLYTANMPKPNNDPEMFDLTISDGLSLRDSPESQPAMCVAKADALGDQNFEVTADDSVSQLSGQISVGVMLLQAELAMARAKQRERQADTKLAELESRIEQAKQNSNKKLNSLLEI